MKIALVTSNIEIYSTYDFDKGVIKQEIKSDIDRSNSFNFFDHDNLFLRKLHLLLNKKKIQIYNNKVNCENIPVYSFRYWQVFNKFFEEKF